MSGSRCPQGYHWNNSQCTLHPIVATYNCPVEECNLVVNDSLVFISNDLKHDHHGVQHYSNAATKQLKDDGIQFQRIVHFSDGTPTQYKNRISFTDCSFGTEDLGVSLEKHYFGSCHGKGPCDREIGVLKKSVTMAVAARQASVSTPREFYEVCKKRPTQPRHDETHVHMRRRFFYVKKEEVQRSRPERVNVKPVKNTRKLHSVRGARPMVIEVRERSCFCSGCRNGDACANASIAGDWKTEEIHAARAAISAPAVPPVASVSTDVDESVLAASADVDIFPQAASIDDNVAALAMSTDVDASSAISTTAIYTQVVTTPATSPRASVPTLASVSTDVDVSFLAASADVDIFPQAASIDNNVAALAMSTYVDASSAISTEDVSAHIPPASTPACKYGDYVLVKFTPNSRTSKPKNFIGLVLSIDKDGSEIEVMFMRMRQTYFIWPDIQDKSWVLAASILARLQPPSIDSRGHQNFDSLPEETVV